jgi:uncharacterized lipoprotein YmbA
MKLLLLSLSLFLGLSGCSSLVQSSKYQRRIYYYYTLKLPETSPPEKIAPVRLAVSDVTADTEFQSKILFYRKSDPPTDPPDQLCRYSAPYYQHLWDERPAQLLTELVESYLTPRVQKYVSLPSLEKVDVLLHLHLKHFEEIQGNPESQVYVEFVYYLLDEEARLQNTGRASYRQKYPTDTGELNHMVSALSEGAKQCMDQILDKITEDL